MGWLQFISSLVDSVAWPLTILATVLVFRGQFNRLLTAPLKALRAGPSGVELEWLDTVTAVRTELRSSPEFSESRDSQHTVGGSASAQALGRLAVAAPDTAVSESLGRVQGELRELLAPVANAEIDGLGPGALAIRARTEGLISDETLRAIQGLVALRYLASAHGPETVDTGQALEYVALADAVLFALRNGHSRR